MESIKNVQRLLEKYFEGQTSLREEATLRSYFKRRNVAPELEYYRPMFQYIRMERSGLRRPIHPLLRVWLPVSSAAAFFLFCVIKLALPAPENLSADSRIYIDGKRYADIELIRTETLNALNRFSEDQPDLYASQAEALNLFCNHN